MEPATPISREQVDEQLAKLNAELDSQKNSTAAQQPATLVDTAMQVGLLLGSTATAGTQTHLVQVHEALCNSKMPFCN